MTRKANEANFFCWKIRDSARRDTVWKWRTGARCDIILKMRSAHLALLFHSCQIRLWHKQFLIREDKRTNTISWLCWDSQPGLWIWIHMNLHLFFLLDPDLHTECTVDPDAGGKMNADPCGSSSTAWLWVPQPVLRIQILIRSDPNLLVRSGSDQIVWIRIRPYV